MVISGTSGAVDRAALLIDADNFHDPVHLRAIHSQFGQHAGKGFVCHAHGEHKQLYREDLKPVWQELAARLLPCLPLNKNTTDAGLIIDALLLHFQFGVRRFGISSGDADFAPLSLQLKELGCEVTCFARKAISFEAMVSYYDRVVRFDVLPVKPESEFVAPVAQIPKPVAVAQPITQAVIAQVPVTSPARGKLVPTPAVTQALPVAKAVENPIQHTVKEGDEVRAILAALPPWLPQTIKQLNQLGAPLRSAGIKKSNAPLHQIFRKYPAYFTVLPLKGHAKQVRLEKRI